MLMRPSFVLCGCKCLVTNGKKEAVNVLINKVKHVHTHTHTHTQTAYSMPHYHYTTLNWTKFERKKLPAFIIVLLYKFRQKKDYFSNTTPCILFWTMRNSQNKLTFMTKPLLCKMETQGLWSPVVLCSSTLWLRQPSSSHPTQQFPLTVQNSLNLSLHFYLL